MNINMQAYNILFIEDEKDIRDNYVKYLKKYFLNVYEAVDGEKAFEIYKEKKPEIIISDINLPKLNGLELIKKIREIDPVVKVIMLTAHSDTEFLLEATELKLVKYLVKPITRDELNEALDLALKEFSKFDIISKNIIMLKDNYEWHCDSQEMFCDSKQVSLTNKETKIISLLFSKPNNTFTYEQIINKVWDDYESSKIEALKTLIKNIRKKLPKNTLKNIFSVGYRV
ncbi:response regulator transcription factor [Sulfurimonas sp.]